MLSPTNFPAAELAAAADDNLATHAGWVHRRTPGMHVAETHGLVLVDSGLACDTFNIVCRARLEAATARDQIREVVGYFAGVARPFSWWLTPGYRPRELGELLEAAGLHPEGTELAMAAKLGGVPAGDLTPDGLRIRRVQTAADLRDLASILAAGWTPPDPEVLRFYELAAPALLAGDAALWLYVGYLDGVPVATAELCVGGGVVGLYNIVTLAAYRRRGFGTAMTLRPLVDARARGYHTAILQASEDGARVYPRLGFATFGQITEYKPGPGGSV